MIIIVEAFRDTAYREKMIITKKVARISNVEGVVRRLQEACMIWETGPKKKTEDSHQR